MYRYAYVFLLLVFSCCISTYEPIISPNLTAYEFGDYTDHLVLSEDEEFATDIVLSYYEKELRKEFYTRYLVVTWVGGVTCTSREDNSTYLNLIQGPEETCFAGLMWSCDQIYVVMAEKHKFISNTAFAHELLHCYFQETREWQSEDHSEWEWKILVPEVNKLLEQYGL